MSVYTSNRKSKTTCNPPKKTWLKLARPTPKKIQETSIPPLHHQAHTSLSPLPPGCQVSPTRGVVAQHYVPWQLVPWDCWSPSPDERLVLCPVGAVSVILRGEDVVEYLYMIYKVQSRTQYDVYVSLYMCLLFTCFNRI